MKSIMPILSSSVAPTIEKESFIVNLFKLASNEFQNQVIRQEETFVDMFFDGFAFL